MSADDNVRQGPTSDKQVRPRRPHEGDLAGVIKFVVLAAVVTTTALTTGSPEAAVIVGSPLVALLRR